MIEKEVKKLINQQEEDFKELMQELESKQKILTFPMNSLTMLQYNSVPKSKITKKIDERFNKMTFTEALDALSLRK